MPTNTVYLTKSETVMSELIDNSNVSNTNHFVLFDLFRKKTLLVPPFVVASRAKLQVVIYIYRTAYVNEQTALINI